ncbi:MAG: substrate-binding domain-containing protein [Kiritimatiellia bacterium]
MSIFTGHQDVIDLKRGNKYFTIARELKRRIDTGQIATRLPSLPEICRDFDTTPVTAHKAIGLLKREGLVTSIKGKGTFVNRLKRPRLNVIEAVLMGISPAGPLHQALIHGMRQTCTSAGQRLVITAHGGKTKSTLDLIREAWDGEKVDGFIVWPPEADRRKEKRWLEYLKEQGTPFVLAPEANPDLYPDCHTVNSDQLSVAEALIAHIVQKGHRKIGFALTTGTEKMDFVKQRYAAYQHILGQKGLKTNPPLPITIDHKGDDMMPRLERGRLADYTAIICTTDLAAAMICRLCLAGGMRVPADLEVTGYDNNPESVILGFSSADQRYREIGKRATRILLDEIEGRQKSPLHEMIKGRPVFR